jgi:hypothetical protein
MKKVILAIGMVALFIGMVVMPAGASLNSGIVKSVHVEQNEPYGIFTHYWVFGIIIGELKIEEVVSCKQVGGTNWYSNVEIRGHAPKTDFGIDDFGVGRWIYRVYGGSDITLTVKFMKNPPDLIVGETVYFGGMIRGTTFGIGIHVLFGEA